MDEAKTYADFGIPGPAPCPSWCSGSHVGSHADPARAVTFHGASAIGGAVLAGGDARHPAGRPGRRPVTAPVVPLRLADDGAAAARAALAAVHRHLDRCKLSASTVKAYKRQTAA